MGADIPKIFGGLQVAIKMGLKVLWGQLIKNSHFVFCARHGLCMCEKCG